MLYDMPIFGGGSGAYVKYLALRLREAYHYDLAVASTDNQPLSSQIKQFQIKLPFIPVFIGRPGLESAKKYSELLPLEIAQIYHGFIDGTIRAVESFKPDIIHVHHVMINSWAARLIRSLYGTRLVLTSHGSCLHAISKDRRYFRMTRDALWAADAVTVVSGDTRAKLLKTFGLGGNLSKKTRTIPGGIRMSYFPPVKDVGYLRKKLGLGNKKVALFTGRIISEKGVEYLVKAARKINGEVLIAGDGPARARLEEIVTNYKLQNVRILPFVHNYKEIVDLYYLADCFVSPAVWDEPLGLTIIEAMASKTPPIVTRKGGVTMAVKDGISGIYVRPRNSTEIAAAVNRIFNNPQLAQKMGERGRKIVEEKFTWTKIAERFDKLYRDVYMGK